MQFCINALVRRAHSDHCLISYLRYSLATPVYREVEVSTTEGGCIEWGGGEGGKEEGGGGLEATIQGGV